MMVLLQDIRRLGPSILVRHYLFTGVSRLGFIIPYFLMRSSGTFKTMFVCAPVYDDRDVHVHNVRLVIDH